MGAIVADTKPASGGGASGDGCSGGDAAPWQATREQERQLELDLANSQPLVSQLQSLWTLVDEYRAEQATVYRQQAQLLLDRYAAIRRVRGDGNCFYRAFAFACLERLASRKVELDRFCLVTASWKERLIKLGFNAMTTEDFHETFMELLSEVDNGMTIDELTARFNVQCNSDYVVAFMRLVTAGYLLENSDAFQAFIDGDRSLKDYCEQEVEPMGRKCDHVSIAALTKALDVPIRIEYMDQSTSPKEVYHHDFCHEPHHHPSLVFLYRPEHYDVLYELPRPPQSAQADTH